MTKTGAQLKESLLAMTEGDVMWVDSEMYISLGTSFEVGDQAERFDTAEVEGQFDDDKEYEVSW